VRGRPSASWLELDTTSSVNVPDERGRCQTIQGYSLFQDAEPSEEFTNVISIVSKCFGDVADA
jgi:hypothetical protein